MAKILISSLGTGHKQEGGSYSKAEYEITKKTYKTTFIADALNEHFDFDKIFLVGTKKSIWDEAYMVFGGEDEAYIEKLYEKKEEGKIDNDFLKKFKASLPLGLEPVVVKYGLNDNELWENFTEFLDIAKNIEDGDELYLDITHSFRSLSLMSFVMTQFAHTISNKNFTIGGVFYGMFEYKWDNNGITPIVDIKILLEIQEWIKAIDAIKNYSDLNPLIRLFDENKIEKDVQNTFINLNNTISLANIASIRQFIKTASKKIRVIEKSENKIIKLLAPEILTLVNNLDKERDSDFQFNLAKWFYSNKNYVLSYIALYEAIITKSCELSKYDISNYELREKAKRSIGDDKYGKHFYTKYDDSISQIRNAIVHQSEDRKDLVASDIQKIETFINLFERYFEIGV